MSLRTPASDPLANSTARLAFIIRGGATPRVIEIGDRSLIVLGLLTALLMAWYLAATLYLVFRDDMVVTLLSGQRRVHYAYEDRILELRQRIDKITAKQLQNQETIEDRVAGIVARQAELEARAVMMADLSNRAEKAGFTRTRSAGSSGTLPDIITGQGLPMGGPALSFAPATERRAKPMPVEMAPAPPSRPTVGAAPKGPMDGVVQEVERRAQRVEETQMLALGEIEQTASAQITQSRQLVSALGLEPGRFGKNSLSLPAIRRPAPLESLLLRDVSSDSPTSDMGGPFMPAGDQKTASFDFLFGRAETALEQAKQARNVMNALPIGRPMSERYEQTSSFGTRLDPFTRSLALHSGIDFRAPTGTPVRAVAAGKVIEAGPNGGYGRMVEIDHGFGITTRYAHLSSIAVAEGEVIAKGAVLGQVGSTGRSTGPHLHYEVRIDDDATDPTRYIRAQSLLAAAP